VEPHTDTHLKLLLLCLPLVAVHVFWGIASGAVDHVARNRDRISSCFSMASLENANKNKRLQKSRRCSKGTVQERSSGFFGSRQRFQKSLWISPDASMDCRNKPKIRENVCHADRLSSGSALWICFSLHACNPMLQNLRKTK
jgi:hypothetical protein